MTISVIVPMYNSRRAILQTLKCLEQQGRSDFEVLVVDDGNTDGSAAVVEDFARQSLLSISVMRQPNTSPAKARNSGAASSRGSVLVFPDSDCVPPPNWLEGDTRGVQNGVAGRHCSYRISMHAPHWHNTRQSLCVVTGLVARNHG